MNRPASSGSVHWGGGPSGRPVTVEATARKAVTPVHTRGHAVKIRQEKTASERGLRGVTGVWSYLNGGGGGNRTPVRRRSAPGATCLVQRSISSRSSTLDKAHRGTSGF